MCVLLLLWIDHIAQATHSSSCVYLVGRRRQRAVIRPRRGMIA